MKTKGNFLDIERLHNVHGQLKESSIGSKRRAGLTTYNFDSCVRLAEIGEPIKIFFITLETGMKGADRYKETFIRFLHEHGEYQFTENKRQNIVSFLNCEVLFTSYERYEKLSIGASGHYVIYDI